MKSTVTKMLALMLSLAALARQPCALTDEMSEACVVMLESALLSSHKDAIKKVGNVIEVHAKNGKVVRFEGNPIGDNYDDFSAYNAVTLLEPGQFVVIIQWRYEGRDVHFVSLLDGTSYKVDGMPIVSPDGNHILVHSMDIDANYDANFIALYRIERSELKREFVISGDEGGERDLGASQN